MSKTTKGYLLLIAFLSFSFGFSQNTKKGSSYKALIKTHLQQKQFNLSENDLNSLYIDHEYLDKKTGITHVYVGQKLQGIKVFNAISSFAIKDGKVAYFANAFVNNASEKINNYAPAVTPQQAISQLASHFNLGDSKGLKTESSSDFNYVFSNENISKENIPVNLGFSLTRNNQLKISWDVTISTLDTKHSWNAKVDGITGEIIVVNDMIIHCQFEENHNSSRAISGHNHKSDHANFNLFKNNQSVMVDGSTYNVFAFPVESPIHGSRQIVTNPADINASPFGWHDTDGVAGAEYTITRGNNVYAQDDTNGNDGFGYAPDGGAALNFDFPYSAATEPENQMDASLANLFYVNNIMHDIWYQYGFDEVAGNFQANNYGKGGAGNDYVIADGLDGESTGNANFGSNADGTNGRMQMFLWNTGGNAVASFEVNSPAGVAGNYPSDGATFGSTSYNVTANLVLANTTEACSALTNAAAINGNIAVIDRGNCEFGLKALNAQNAGAVAVIVINNVTTGTIPMGPGANGGMVNIPAIMISMEDGATLKAQLPGANATLIGEQRANQLDGSFDNGIVAHEYGHGISTRMTGAPSNPGCLSNDEQMGEGWSDWFGLMITIEDGDTETDARGIGTFATGSSTSGTGIRTYQYSTDMGINPHTYNSIKTEAIPHGVGSVWAAMLWDMSWAIMDLEGYDPDLYYGTGGNNIAMHLVTQALKLQPCSPGFVDGRDAILAADQLLYDGAYRCVIWEVFARRGLGFSANQGNSGDRSDGTEAFDVPSDLGVSLTSSSDLNIAEEGQAVTFSIDVSNCNADTNVNVSSSFMDNNLDYVADSASDNGSFSTNTVIYPEIANLTQSSNLTFTYQVTIKNGSYYAPVSIFQDELDNGDNWTDSGSGQNGWVIANSAPCSSSAFFCANVEGNSESFMTSDPFTPTGVASISFDHSFNTETNWDGGFIEITNDGGTTWNDLGPYFESNGYNDYVNNNPGTPAFSGNSGGCMTSTTLPLTAFPGTIQIRFRFITDELEAADGWYINSVSLTDHAAAIIENQVTGTNFSDTQAHAVLINENLSVADIQIEGLSIYPNPTNGMIYIESPQSLNSAKVTVYDIMGRILSNRLSTSTLGNNKISVDMSNLSTGAYFISVENNGLKSTKKVIKN